MNKYTVITEKDVLDLILYINQDWHGIGIISPSNIASLLKTSRYQVNKHIKSLKNKKVIEYKSILCSPEDEYYPPYNGYGLSTIGREKYKKELKEISDEQDRLIKKHFS